MFPLLNWLWKLVKSQSLLDSNIVDHLADLHMSQDKQGLLPLLKNSYVSFNPKKNQGLKWKTAKPCRFLFTSYFITLPSPSPPASSQRGRPRQWRLWPMAFQQGLHHLRDTLNRRRAVSILFGSPLIFAWTSTQLMSCLFEFWSCQVQWSQGEYSAKGFTSSSICLAPWPMIQQTMNS